MRMTASWFRTEMGSTENKTVTQEVSRGERLPRTFLKLRKRLALTIAHDN